MLAVDKENGLHGASYVEFLSRIMQHDVLCSYESNGGFSKKLTKYDPFAYVHVIYRYTRLWRVSFIA